MRFGGIVSPTSVSFTGITGKNFSIPEKHPNNARIRELMRETQAAFRAGEDARATELWGQLTELADIALAISSLTAGRVVVSDNEVKFEGKTLHNAITNRILWCIDAGYDPSSYMRFLDNLMDNPSKRAVDELFGFMEACSMGITDDGYVLAYKRVRGDYMDIYSSSISNAVGQKPSMPRNAVDDDKTRTCSEGLHFCSFSYLPKFGVGGKSKGTDRVMILKINPRDVVSIPVDYNNSKGRACLYEVIDEYVGDDLADILASKPVWNSSSIYDTDYTEKVIDVAEEADGCFYYEDTLIDDVSSTAKKAIVEFARSAGAHGFSEWLLGDLDTISEVSEAIKTSREEANAVDDDDDYQSNLYGDDDIVYVEPVSSGGVTHWQWRTGTQTSEAFARKSLALQDAKDQFGEDTNFAVRD